MKLVTRRTLLAGSAIALAGLSANAIAQKPRGYGRSVTRADARLYVEIHGRGAPILLLHGGLGHMGWFDGLRRHLVLKGRRVVLIDTRGMGRSTMGTELTYQAQEMDAHAVLDTLEIARCPVIGFSDGGIVGYRLAARADSRVTQLITIGARWSAENGRGMWPTFDSWNRKSLSAGDFKFIVDDYDRLNPDRDFDRLMRSVIPMWKDAGPTGHPEASIEQIGQPVLIAVGDRDPFLSVTDAAVAKSKIKNAQLLVMPSATHPAYRERPDIFFPAMDKFLSTKG
ncbi:MAG: alpha/beta fold hydrolase [Burkholderiaceae bacterium]